MEYQEHGASDEELDSERVSVPEGQENGPSEDDGSEEETEVFDGRTLNSGDWSSLELHCPIYKANGEGSGGKFRGPEHFLHAPRPVSPADPMGVRKSNHNGNKSSPSKSIAAAVAQQAAEDQPQSDSQFTSTGQDQLQSESQSTSTGEEQPQSKK